MSNFRRYDHVERFGRVETAGIDIGDVYVFPKLDGTNASVWVDDGGSIQCGSRNRTLSAGKDNAGFHAWVSSFDDVAVRLRGMLLHNPHLTVYGEWLCPHTLKTYRDEAWRRFWIFDVFDHTAGHYIAYNAYKTMLETAKQDVIAPLCIIKHPSIEQLNAAVSTNTFLVKDGEGAGEGVVLKNYLWTNKFGRQPWAKIVRTEFKELNAKVFGPTEKSGPAHVESEIAERYVTQALVDKTRAKIVGTLVNDTGLVLVQDGSPELDYEFTETATDTKLTPVGYSEFEQKNRGKVIPELLHRVFYDVVNEDLWDALKRHKNPTIDFKKLRSFVTMEVKTLAKDLF